MDGVGDNWNTKTFEAYVYGSSQKIFFCRGEGNVAEISVYLGNGKR